ncbi:unnamed protein product [Calypogeia fissa]
MKAKRSSNILPDDVVEKIIAMMPFPSIFKARLLSKSWLAKFSSASSQDDEVKKLAAITFQKQKELCFMQRLYYIGNILTGSWKQLPSRPKRLAELQYLEKVTLHPVLVRDSAQDNYEVIVLQGYAEKFRHFNLWYAQIYESTSNRWSTKKLVGELKKGPRGRFYGSIGRPVCLDGILYFAECVGFRKELNYLLAFNIAQGTFEELVLSFSGPFAFTLRSHLIVCNSKLMIVRVISFSVVCEGPWTNDLMTGYNRVITSEVSTVDLGSLQVLEVTKGPQLHLSKPSSEIREAPCTDGNCLFARMFVETSDTVTSDSGSDSETTVFTTSHGQTAVYNLREDEWGTFNVPPTMTAAYRFGAVSFSSGLNPFVEV